MSNEQYGLGRLPSPFDPNDWRLNAFIPKGEALKILKENNTKELDWDFPYPTLQQLNTNHCVGFSGGSYGICSPINDKYNDDIGHTFYYMCKEIDGEPDSEDGSYVRSIAKVLKDVGRIDAYAFAFSIEEIVWWLLNKGPVIVGTVWTDDMFESDLNNIIHITGDVVGGHAYLLKGVKIIDGIRHFIIKNSWGDGWGRLGEAYISLSDFEILFKYGGEAMTAVELPLIEEKPHYTPNTGCIGAIIRFFRELF